MSLQGKYLFSFIGGGSEGGPVGDKVCTVHTFRAVN
jgi:hypothetical protein